jgi:Glycosyl hydrolase family 3 N terminal domain
MATNFTRRELGKLAGTGALVMSASATIGRSTSATEATARSTTVAQATTQSSEQRAMTSDASGTAMQRADELLRTMTIAEKAMQLSAVMPFVLLGPEGPIRSQLDAELKNGIGHVSGLGLFGYKTPETTAKTINAIQRYLVTETRLGIPAIFHNEALNGVVSRSFTHFPTAIGLAATWDPDAVEEMADLMRRQMRSVGLLQALAPVMDVARDARWGRVHETYGEDPLPGYRHERRLHAGHAGERPARGRAGEREALPRLCSDRSRSEHGRDRRRRARAL